jgi:hypothetical protein
MFLSELIWLFDDTAFLFAVGKEKIFHGDLKLLPCIAGLSGAFSDSTGPVAASWSFI